MRALRVIALIALGVLFSAPELEGVGAGGVKRRRVEKTERRGAAEAARTREIEAEKRRELFRREPPVLSRFHTEFESDIASPSMTLRPPVRQPEPTHTPAKFRSDESKVMARPGSWLPPLEESARTLHPYARLQRPLTSIAEVSGWLSVHPEPVIVVDSLPTAKFVKALAGDRPVLLKANPSSPVDLSVLRTPVDGVVVFHNIAARKAEAEAIHGPKARGTDEEWSELNERINALASENVSVEKIAPRDGLDADGALHASLESAPHGRLRIVLSHVREGELIFADKSTTRLEKLLSKEPTVVIGCDAVACTSPEEGSVLLTIDGSVSYGDAVDLVEKVVQESHHTTVEELVRKLQKALGGRVFGKITLKGLSHRKGAELAA